MTSVATQRSLLQTTHGASPNASPFGANNSSLFHPNKYLEKDNYQIDGKSKLSLPPEPERLRLKTPEKSLSNDKLSDKNARLRLSQDGLCDRNERIPNERLCLSSERLNHNFNEKNDDRRYHSNIITDANRNDEFVTRDKDRSLGVCPASFKNDERSYRSQENLDSKFQQKIKNSPTFQEQKERFLQEIKEKANGLNEKHFKNVKNDSDKFQKSPVVKDIKDKKTVGTPRRNVPNFLASKNIPENFSPGPQLVPERDLNSVPLRNCEVDFFSNSKNFEQFTNLQNNSSNLGQKIEDIEIKHDDYFRIPRDTTGSLQELSSSRDESKPKSEHDNINGIKNNENKYGRLETKSENSNPQAFRRSENTPYPQRK